MSEQPSDYLDGTHIADPVDHRKGLAIVRELAERGPFIDNDGDHCADCFVKGGLNVPANHDPDCLWRRARMLYPEATG